MALIEEFNRVDPHAHDDARIRGALLPLLDDSSLGVVLVVDDDDDLQGYAVLTWGYSLESGGIEALVDEIFVADRNRGIGAGLLAACVEAARENGARVMFLETERTNERVRGFYARHGFTADDSIWMSRTL